MVEEQPGPALVGVRRELWMAIRQAGELSAVARHASLVRHSLQFEAATMMLAVAGAAGQRTFATARRADDDRRQGDRQRRARAGGSLRTRAQRGELGARLAVGVQAVRAEFVTRHAAAAVLDRRRGGEGGVKPAGGPAIEGAVAAAAGRHVGMLKGHRAGRHEAGGGARPDQQHEDTDGHDGDPARDEATLGPPAAHRAAPGDRPAAGAVGQRPLRTDAARDLGPRTVPAVLLPDRLALEGGSAATLGIGPNAARLAVRRPTAHPGLVGPQVKAATVIEVLEPLDHDTPPVNA